jgi:hypothetical protein
MKALRNKMIIGLAILAVSASVSYGSTIVVSDTSASPGDTAVMVTISLNNLEPYAGFEMALQYNTSLLNLNRLEPTSRLSDQTGTGYYEFSKGKMSMVVFDFNGTNLPAGSNPVLNAYFDVSPDSSRARAQISITEITAVLENLEYDSVDVQDGYIQVPFGPSCQYVIGDINNNGAANGIDVTYGVSYLKGGNAPPVSCDCPPHGMLYVAGDVNGNCSFNGIDITYYVSYLKGGPTLIPCVDCPPVVLSPLIPAFEPREVPVLKSKGNIKPTY